MCGGNCGKSRGGDYVRDDDRREVRDDRRVERAGTIFVDDFNDDYGRYDRDRSNDDYRDFERRGSSNGRLCKDRERREVREVVIIEPRRGNGCKERVIEEPCCRRPVPKVEVRYERGRGGRCGCERVVCGCEKRLPEPARISRCCDDRREVGLFVPPGSQHPRYPGLQSRAAIFGKPRYTSAAYQEGVVVNWEGGGSNW